MGVAKLNWALPILWKILEYVMWWCLLHKRHENLWSRMCTTLCIMWATPPGMMFTAQKTWSTLPHLTSVQEHCYLKLHEIGIISSNKQSHRHWTYHCHVMLSTEDKDCNVLTTCSWWNCLKTPILIFKIKYKIFMHFFLYCQIFLIHTHNCEVIEDFLCTFIYCQIFLIHQHNCEVMQI